MSPLKHIVGTRQQPTPTPPPPPPEPDPDWDPPEGRGRLALASGLFLIGAALGSALVYKPQVQQQEIAPAQALHPSLAERVYDLPTVEHEHPRAHEVERSPEIVAAQQAAVEDSLSSGRTVEFRNSEGQTAQVLVQRTAGGYRYQLNGASVDVRIEVGEPVVLLGRILDYHSQVPRGFQNLIKAVSVFAEVPGSNVRGRYAYGSQSMQFWGERSVSETNFTHEVGHAIGRHVERNEDSLLERILQPEGEAFLFADRTSNVPDDWTRIHREEAPFSQYARTSPQEDFADFWTAFHEARESGESALRQLREKYPRRTRVMDRVLQYGAQPTA